jgi:hypothetical protein
MKRLAIFLGFLVVSLVAALAPAGDQTEAQANCFPETGFCITNSAFADYFNQRGQVRTHGYPISRSFTLEGFEVQIFQRIVLQLQGGTVQRLNVLDPDIMPLTRANQSVFPGPDAELARSAPQVGSPDYAQRVVEFVRSVAPDTFQGLPVNFFNTFNTAVPVQPGTSSDIQTLLNLEIWGVPTSRPAFDPGNQGFVYQRFQRGIMHFRAEVPVTEGILIGEYFKAVITARNLPSDLAEDMRNSRFYAQCNTSAPNWVARPNELANTNLTNAFDCPSGPAPGPQPGPQPGPTSTPSPTSTPGPDARAPEITTFRVDDDTVDVNDRVEVTIIARARDDRGIDVIQFEGRRDEDDDNDNGSDDIGPELERREFDCDEQRECAWIFDFRPSRAGDFILRARARDTEDTRSEWSEIQLEVRQSGDEQPEISEASINDDDIRLGDSARVRVTARDDIGLDRLELEGVNTGDPALDTEQRHDCDDRRDCSHEFTVTPTRAGQYTLQVRARDTAGQDEDTTVRLEVRSS